MERTKTNKLEAALLYSGMDTYEPGIWLKLINEFAAGFSMSFSRTKQERTPHYFHMTGHGLTIEISCAKTPIENDVFRNALASEVTRREFPDCFAMVAGHEAFVHMSITKGEVSQFDALREDDGRNPPMLDDMEYDFATAMLRTMLTMQIASSIPMAVYWEPCDRLLEPRKFLRISVDIRDNALLVHPVYFQAEGPDAKRGRLGIKTYGARYLIGCELVMDPSQVPVEELTQMALHFIGITRNTGLLLPDGDVFGRDESETIEVRYESRENASIKLGKLRILHSDKHGIDIRPKEGEEAEADLDLDDPAERALHQKIEELKAQAAAAEVALGKEHESAKDVELFERELQPEWTGVRKKVDMDKLRNLTVGRSAQPDGSDPAPQAPEKANGRVGGFFSRR